MSSSKSPPRKRVLVVGLKGAQLRIIEDEFSDALDLRFAGADKGFDALRRKASSADVTLFVRDKLGHKHRNTVAALNVAYVEIAGGLTSLRSELRRHLPKGDDE
jgi:hypothetical protein